MSKFTKRMANKQRKGFTLVELVVVILIIAVLAAIAFMGGATAIRQSRESRVQSDLKNFGTYVQDMLYDNPDLQQYTGVAGASNKGYGTTESYTFDAKNDTFTGGTDALESAFGTFTAAAITDFSTINMPVLKMLNSEYLTDDFQLGDIKDAWDTPYCYSYNMLTPDACIIVINSQGTNTLDESSNQTGVTGMDKVAATYVAGLGTTYISAEAVCEAIDDADTTGDDYGVVIVMIDGEVSVGYYGF